MNRKQRLIKKQILIVLSLFIISLLAVSAVSAADHVDDRNMSTTADGIMQVTNTQEDILSDDAGTFIQLNEKIQGVSSVTLDKNYTYAGEGIVSNVISITNDIEIDGNGYTIDGANQVSIFDIRENVHVVLKNINFVNANGINGGALRWTPSAHVNISNCNFINNSASGDGGAIYINATSSMTSTLTTSEPNFYIEDCTFINNTAGDDGGAIYANEVSGIISNIISINNKGVSANKTNGETSSTRGGAICLTGDHVVVSQSTFTNCSAYMDEGKNSSKVDGGALFITGNNVNVTDTTFTDCSATNNGGAIYIIGNNAVVNNCTFTNNYGFDGASIYVAGNDTDVHNTIFTNNTAGDDGAAIYWEGNRGVMYNITCINNKGVSAIDYEGNTSNTRGGTICLTGNDVIISKSTFIDCSGYMDAGKDASRVDGGALFITGNNVNITETTFDNCTTLHDGGAIYIIGNNTLLDDCAFNNCTTSDRGGAIYVIGNSAMIDNSVFTNNYAYIDGASIYVAGDDAKLYNSKFINNTASDDGGAVHWDGNRGIIYNITCINNKGISVGDSNTHGGSICLTGDNATITKSSFTHSSATVDENRISNKVGGGALFLTGNNINVTDTTFDDCTGPYGGAIYIVGNNTRILDCTLDSCTAVEGGSILIEGHDAHILQSNIANSRASDAGGVYVNGPNTVISANFVNCTATGDNKGSRSGNGGAISIYGENTKITESTFLNTSADLRGDGGAIYIKGIDTTIEKSDFKSTSADDGKGGAIYIAGNNAHVLDSTFSETHAENGGAVYISGLIGQGDYAKILDCNITSSTSDFDGGAVYVAGDHAVVSVNINNTKANSNGGAVYVAGRNSTITESTFEDCSAGLESAGGAIYITGSYATVEKSTFHNTYAINGTDNATGGAIAIVGEFATVDDSYFNECYAYNGGVISVQGRYAKVKDSHMSDSAAVNNGGAVYISGGERTEIYSSTFDNCEAQNNDGGAIFIDGPYTTIEDSEFINCSASSENAEGGAIYINGRNTTITNATFDSCVSVDGGAIYIQGINTKIFESEFIGNKLINYTNDDNYGGAIFVNGENALISTSTFKNHSAFTGGSIYINGTHTTISDSNFTQSTADYGGAIYVNGANAHIAESTFEDGNAVNDGGAIYVAGLNTNVEKSKFNNVYANNGGAITIVGSSATVSESEFENTNAQNGKGGAIDIIGENTIIKDSNFTSSNSNVGGAIYVTGDNAAISSSYFSGISSTTNGGAIYVAGKNTNISSSTFESCNSYALGVGNYSGGGAIYVVGDGTVISGSEFASSISMQKGGAIYVAGKNTLITTSNFTYNHAAESGGAIYISKYESNGTTLQEAQNTTIEDCLFTENYALNSGGAVKVSGTNTTINRSSFIKNKLTYTRSGNDACGVGGALYIDGVNATVQYSSFTENSCTSRGGGIFWNGGHGGDSIIGCNFTRNKVTVGDSLGGGVYWSAAGSITPGGLVKDSIFDGNSATKHGGGMDWHRSYNSVMENCTFINNYALKDGAGFYIGDTNGNSRNITLTDCKFINNTADYAGGAISVQMSESHIINSTFDGNSAVYGGSIIIKDCVTTGTEIIGCNFTDSHAKNGTKHNDDPQSLGKGGAIFARDYSITVDDCTFINCTADTDGGAIYWDGGMNYDTNNVNKLTDKKAPGTNHPLRYLGIDGVVSNSIFINNTAVNKGGAVCWHATNGTISNSNFTGNNATYGGAVYWEGGVEYIHYKNNYNNLIAVHGDNGKVYNSTFTKNTAQNGGAVYWTATNGTIANSTFTENAANKGGAVYWNNITQTASKGANNKTVSSGQNGLISNSEFINNRAEGSDALGGALYWNTSSSNVSDVTFLNNTAELGGAVYWSNGKLIDNATFKYNKAVNGSAMYVDNSTPEMDIVDSTFLENQAHANCFDNVTFVVNDTTTTFDFTAYFRGNDNIINAIYNAGENNVYFTNVQHLDKDGVRNTGVDRIAPVVIDIPQDPNVFYQTDREAYQTVVVSVYDINNNEIIPETTMKTDWDGKISIHDNKAVEKGSLKIQLVHPEDNYYTQLDYVEGANSTLTFVYTANITVGQTEVINITVIPKDDTIMVAPTGNITFWIGDNKDYYQIVNFTSVDGRCATAQVNITGLHIGEYTAYAKYNGDVYFMPSNGKSLFIVSEVPDDIFIDTVDIYVGQIEPINITVDPRIATGNVSVVLASEDGNYYYADFGDIQLHDGIINLPVKGLPAGLYRVNATYNGDVDFKPVSNTSVFKVSKHTPGIFIVYGKDIFVYQNGTIWVDLPENATGFVYIKVNNHTYYINLSDTRIIPIEMFDTNGTYFVYGNYSGDDYWDSMENTTTFTVSKYNITLDVQTADIVYGDMEYLNVTLQFKNATGTVRIRVNGTGYDKVFEDVPIAGGVARLSIPGLAPGYYDVEAIYPGDKQYNGNSTRGNFTVGKAHIPLRIVADNFTFDKTGKAYIYVDTTGKVNATIQGRPGEIPIDLENGEAYYNLAGFKPGVYNISAHFAGNEYYYPADNQTVFEVYKLTKPVDIQVQDIVYGETEHVKIYVNASGFITIFANGENKTVPLSTYEESGNNPIVHGSYDDYIADLPVGTYTVKVNYNGNDFYFPSSAEAQFRVIPRNTTLVIDPQNILVWDDEYLTVSVTDGNNNILTNASGLMNITIGNVTYTNQTVNGVAKFVISNLTVGDKYVWAVYAGDRNHNGSHAISAFNVAPRVPIINVTGQNIDVGFTEVIHVEIPANATGRVILTGNFTADNIELDKFNGGKVDHKVHNLTAGTYSIHIVYYGGGQDNYTIAEADTSFIVTSVDTPIDIDVEDIDYKQTANITVSVKDDATGVITVKIVDSDGNPISEKQLAILDGKVNWLVDNLAVDNYTVYASYSGNSKYNPNQTSEQFKVKKIAPTIIIDSVEVSSVTNATVVVHITPGTTGNVTITVNKKNYTNTINNGVVKFIIDQLNSGNYTVDAYYPGDRNYTEANNFTENGVIVHKFKGYDMNVTAENTKVDLNSTIVVNVPSDAEGVVAIYVNGTFVGNANITNGVAQLNVIQNISSLYGVIATFSDDKYEFKTVDTTYFVDKWDTPMSVGAHDATVGETVKVTVTVPVDIKGNVTIKVDGVSYTNSSHDGKAVFYINNVTYGNKTVLAMYDGDNKYKFNYTDCVFSVTDVPKPDVPISGGYPMTVQAHDTKVGLNTTIVVNVPSDAKGNVSIYVAGTFVGNATVNNGVAKLNVTKDISDIYDVFATFHDDTYALNNASTRYFVDKWDTPMSVGAHDATVGETVMVVVTVPEDITDDVTIKVDGVSYTNSSHNGVAVFYINNVTYGNKTVLAMYDGNNKYRQNHTDCVFSVTDLPKPDVPISGGYPMTVQAHDTKVGLNTTIVVNLPTNADGNVSIYVAGTFVGNATVNNGVAKLNVTQDISDIYDVFATFQNDKYALNNASTRYYVSQWDTPIVITIEDEDNIHVGDVVKIIVSVPEDVKESVTIELAGKSYTNMTYGGNATFYVSDLLYGDKTVTATYVGDNKYVFNSTTANFTVRKYDMAITVSGINITVGDVEQITVTAPADVTRPVLVDVDGKGYYVNIIDGKGTLEIAGLLSGPYNVTAAYLGDDKYNGAKANNSFVVSKVPSSVIVTAENITVGDKEFIEITVPFDARDIVKVTVAGKDYDVYVAGGKGYLVVPGLKVDNYTVDAIYLGDVKYEQSENSTMFVVSPKGSDIIVKDKGNNTIEVIIGDNATGQVTVTIEGKNFTANVTNGTATVKIENITPGVHEVEVVYSGDENHTSATATDIIVIPGGDDHDDDNTTVEKTKITPDLVVIDQGNGTVVVVVADNATGEVTITVEGKNFTGEVIDGVAVITLENVTPGVHDIDVYYSGDENYTNATADGTVTIPRWDAVIIIDAYDIYVGDAELINVTLPNGATGNVLIEINGYVYEPVVVDGNVIRFVVENLTAGGKTVVAYYDGDETYFPRNVTERFNVYKRDSTVSAEIKDIYVGENVVVVVKVLDDATGQVLIDIDGVTYYANVTNGFGSVEIPRMLSGIYPVNLTYVGDDKYLPSHNTSLFRVSKVPSFVIPVAQNIYVGELENLMLSVPIDAVGNVTLMIDGDAFNINLAEGVLAAVYAQGEKYTVAISGGNGVLVVEGLPEGEYLVSARYNGDDKYLPSENETVFNVTAPYVPEIIHEDDNTTNLQMPENETEVSTPVEEEPVVLTPVEEETPTEADYFGDVDKNKTTVGDPIDTPISVGAHDIYVGETETVVVTVPEDANGTITIEIDGVKYTTTEIIDGKATFKVENLTAGDKTVIAEYSGNEKYTNNSTTGKFTVYKLPSTVNATGNDIEVGKDEVIDVVVPKDATGTITIEIDGVNYTTTEIVDGHAKVVIPNLPAGEYTAKVYYSGNDKYLPSSNTVTFNVIEVNVPEEEEEDEPEIDDGDDEIDDDDDDDVVDDDVPENETTGKATHVAKKAQSSGVALSQHETGNPILALLLILVVVGSSRIRRFK